MIHKILEVIIITYSNKFAIFVIAFERVDSFNRLLHSLQIANYDGDVISLFLTIGKKEDNKNVLKIARDFEWSHGDKIIKYLENETSITDHYHLVLKLGLEFDNIIVLEDDLYVSPSFYLFAKQALQFLQDTKNVAGVSLNNIWFNGYTKYPFIPIKDEADNYFMQIPYYNGQAFNNKMIKLYLEWKNINQTGINNFDHLHEKMISLAKQDDEWFPLMTKYLVETEQYFLFPYTSLSTNFGDQGKHFSSSTNYFQIPLEMKKSLFEFTEFENSISLYDSFHEINPLCLFRMGISKKLKIPMNDLAIDLEGTKSQRLMQKKYVLTIRRVKESILTFGGVMKPMIQNVISDIPGAVISLAKPKDLIFTKGTDISLQQLRYDYFNIESYELTLISLLRRKFRRLFRRSKT